MRLSDLIGNRRVVSIIGLAKNTGKTVCLTQMVGELTENQVPFGVTSAGRDGERTDTLDETLPKPPITLPEGALFSSTATLLERNSGWYGVVHDTGISTAVGAILVCRVERAGNFEIAGPSAAQQTRMVGELMLSHGAALVIIDGALNRKAASAPDISDGVILSTGAVLSADPERAVSITKSHFEMLTIPRVSEEVVAAVQFPPGCRVVGIDRTNAVVPMHWDPLSGIGARIAQSVPDNLVFLVFKHALIEATIDSIMQAKGGQQPTFVVRDSARLFVSPKKWEVYRSGGAQVRALRSTNVLAVTVNPTAPTGYRFDAPRFLRRMRGAIKCRPVFDVRLPAYPQVVT